MVVKTTMPLRMYFREQMTRYFRTEDPTSIRYLYNIVISLEKLKGANTLKEDLGQKDYDSLQRSLSRFQDVYAYAEFLRKSTIHRGSDDPNQETINENAHQKLLEICSRIAIIRQDIIRACFLLVNNTDLRDIAIPLPDDRTPQRGRYALDRPTQ